jgi:hypothetical protein
MFAPTNRPAAIIAIRSAMSFLVQTGAGAGLAAAPDGVRVSGVVEEMPDACRAAANRCFAAAASCAVILSVPSGVRAPFATGATGAPPCTGIGIAALAGA